MYLLILTVAVDEAHRARLREAAREAIVSKGFTLSVSDGVEVMKAQEYEVEKQVSRGAGWVLYQEEPLEHGEPDSITVHMALVAAHERSAS